MNPRKLIPSLVFAQERFLCHDYHPFRRDDACTTTQLTFPTPYLPQCIYLWYICSSGSFSVVGLTIWRPEIEVVNTFAQGKSRPISGWCSHPLASSTKRDARAPPSHFPRLSPAQSKCCINLSSRVKAIFDVPAPRRNNLVPIFLTNTRARSNFPAVCQLTVNAADKSRESLRGQETKLDLRLCSTTFSDLFAEN